MLVIIAESGLLLSPGQVCCGCLMADRAGQPRWRDGQLHCGQCVRGASDSKPACFECAMGFTLAWIDG